MEFIYAVRNDRGDITGISARRPDERSERLPRNDAEVEAFLDSLNPPRAPAQPGSDSVRLFKALRAKGLIDDADYDAEPTTPLRM